MNFIIYKTTMRSNKIRLDKEFSRLQESLYKVSREHEHSFTFEFLVTKSAYKGQTHIINMITNNGKKTNYKHLV